MIPSEDRVQQRVARQKIQLLGSDRQHPPCHRGCGVVAARPGNFESSFAGISIVPVGQLKLFTYTILCSRGGKTKHPVGAMIGWTCRFTETGFEWHPVCGYDTLQPFAADSKAPVLDPASLLASLALSMDRTSTAKFENRYKLPSQPCLPQILLGFAPGQLPEFWDQIPVIVSLFEKLAFRGTSEQFIATFGADAYTRLAQEHTKELVTAHDDPTNPTGMDLVPYVYCQDTATQALRHFHDCRLHLGVNIPNPMQSVGRRVVEIHNPAKTVMAVDNIGGNVGVEQFRALLGEDSAMGSDDDIFSAMDKPDEPIRVSIGLDWFKLDQDRLLAELRSHVPEHVRDVVTNEELLAAAEKPKAMLRVANAYRHEAFVFDTDGGARGLDELLAIPYDDQIIAAAEIPAAWLRGMHLLPARQEKKRKEKEKKREHRQIECAEATREQLAAGV